MWEEIQKEMATISGDTSLTAAASTTSSFRFDAFISYRRQDGAWHAKNLRRRLLEASIPQQVGGEKQRRLSVYLDTIYERATEDFFEHTIKPALAASRHLIVIQSPSASKPLAGNQPNWLVREIEYFISLPPEGRSISVVITSGDFDATLPGNLHNRFPNIERLDLSRWRWYRPGVADEAVLTLTATLHDISADRMPLLRQEDAKRQARRWRSRAISAAALVIVLIGLLALVIALYSRSEERRLLATSRALAVQAMDRSDKDLDLSLLLSAESHTAADTLESRKALLQNLLANPHLNRFLHGDSAVASLAFHPGQPMLAALSNRSIFIWDILSNQRPLDLAEGETKYRALRFFDSGKTLAATTSDGTLVLWDFETRKRIASIAPAKPNYSCASPVATNRPVLATETPSSILIWDLTSKSVCSTIDLEKDDAILNVAPSPSGEVVAVNTRNYGVRLWDVEKHLYRSTKFHGHSGFIDAVTFSPDGKVIATGSFDESVILWDVETGSRKEWWTKQKAPVSMLEFSPDDRFIAWGTRSGKVQIFDKIENRFLKMPGLGFRFLDALVFSLDSRTLAIAGGGQIAVLDLLKENRISTVHPTRQRIIGIVFSPSDNLAASAGADGEVILWDTNHKTVLGQSTAPLPLGGCMGFSPDGQKLITCNKAGTAFLWEIANGSARFLGTISSESGKITAVAFHSGGKGVVSGDESGLVSSWEAASPLGSKPRPLTSVGCRIANVAFSLGGDLIAFGCTEGEVHLINFLGQHLAKFKNDSHPITGVAFSPDGQQLFTSGQEGIVTWNLKSGTKVGTPLELRQLGADSLALSPRGNVIASASRTGWIGLWDTETKSLLGDFQSHGDAFYSVALAPSGRLLAAGSGYLAGADDALMFLDLDPKNWVQHACAIAARNMTPEEWRRYMSEGSPSDTCASHHAHE